MSMDEYFKWQRDCIAEMLRVSRGLVFYNIQMINGNKLALFRLFGEFYEYIKEVIIWDKNNAEPAIHDGVLNSRYEYIIVLDKTNAISRQFNVFNAAREMVDAFERGQRINPFFNYLVSLYISNTLQI